MEIAIRTQADVSLVALAGHLDTNTSAAAQEALDGLRAGGSRKIVVDCTAMEYISSAGLRVLLGTVKGLEREGGTLRLFGLNETVREVFDISGFSMILPVFDTEAEALRGLEG
jgi:anti-anti-sigma factor